MRRDDAMRILSAHQGELIKYHVKTLALFGSVARDDARPDSDVDVLVEFDGPATFDAYVDLKFFLEDLLQRRVDLVTRKALRPEIAPRVERDLRRVA
jgi:predicted nucleotidyltransferase